VAGAAAVSLTAPPRGALLAAMPLVTWAQLGFNTKCIYQAFAKANGVTDSGQTMAGHVNSLNIDADDGKAVVVLAKKYGFRLAGAWTGAVFLDEVRFDKPGTELVVIVTTAGDIPSPVRPGALTQFSSMNLSGDKLLYDPKYDGIQWHAIYGRVGTGSRITWTDDQRQRPTGPTRGDLVVVYEKVP
jgi:hypothetical protein